MLLTPRIGPTPVLFLQDSAVLRDVSEFFAVVALHITAGVHHLHGNATAYDRLSFDRARKIVDVHSVYCAECRPAQSPASRSWRFVPSRTRGERLGERCFRTSRRVLSLPFPQGSHGIRPERKRSRPDPGRAPSSC